MARLNIDVIDIGRKSERLADEEVFVTGLMDAAFH